MILAISGSPRKNRMVHNTIKAILAGCKDEYEIISLSGKKISGCIACLQCAKDNICKLKDDWNDIGEKMKQADIIIFGAPNYYGTVNALSHCCLERTFCFRHKGGMTLKDKKAIIVTTQRVGANVESVKEFIEYMLHSNQMKVIGEIRPYEYSQCYSCGEGKNCSVGSVVRVHGVLEEILPKHLPLEIEQQTDTMQEIEKIRELLLEHGVKF